MKKDVVMTVGSFSKRVSHDLNKTLKITLESYTQGELKSENSHWYPKNSIGIYGWSILKAIFFKDDGWSRMVYSWQKRRSVVTGGVHGFIS